MADKHDERHDDGPAPTLRVRIIDGPDEEVIGKIGYLFDFTKKDTPTSLPDLIARELSYILTVIDTEVRRLHLHEGYQYQVEEI